MTLGGPANDDGGASPGGRSTAALGAEIASDGDSAQANERPYRRSTSLAFAQYPLAGA
jgi:hypothetical protein